MNGRVFLAGIWDLDFSTENRVNRINDEAEAQKEGAEKGKGLKPIETSNYKVY